MQKRRLAGRRRRPQPLAGVGELTQGYDQAAPRPPGQRNFQARAVGRDKHQETLREVGCRLKQHLDRHRPAGYAFLCQWIEPADRSELLDLLHYRMFPRWLAKQINPTPLRAGDIAARARVMRALKNLAYVYSQWRNAGLPVLPLGVAAE
jgi:hypothetical protein